jgi:hypothetical protein
MLAPAERQFGERRLRVEVQDGDCRGVGAFFAALGYHQDMANGGEAFPTAPTKAPS